MITLQVCRSIWPRPVKYSSHCSGRARGEGAGSGERDDDGGGRGGGGGKSRSLRDARTYEWLGCEITIIRYDLNRFCLNRIIESRAMNRNVHLAMDN